MKSLFLSFCIIISFSLFSPYDGNSTKIIGVKIYKTQENYLPLFLQWKEMGINTAFVSVALAYDKLFRKHALENKVQVFIIIPVFFNSDALKENPKWYAITEQGKVAKDEWVEFISPSNEEYRSQRISFIKKVVQDTKPDGISLDFIRYFAYWEKIQAGRSLASIPNTSFDSESLTAFQLANEIQIPSQLATPSSIANWILENHLETWTNWKCGNIVSLVGDIVNVAHAVHPELLINLHAVPWREHDFDGAIRKIVGQDFKQLAPLTDYISPMCYSHMLNRNASWVSSVTRDIQRQAPGVKVLPSIQVKEAYLDNVLSESEFKENLEAALEAPSKGVIFWSWAHLDQEPLKKSIIANAIEANSK